jgi:hypothetical protein
MPVDAFPTLIFLVAPMRSAGTMIGFDAEWPAATTPQETLAHRVTTRSLFIPGPGWVYVPLALLIILVR